MPVTKVNPHIEAEQVERLRAMRAKRDAVAHAEALARVEATAREAEQRPARRSSTP